MTKIVKYSEPTKSTGIVTTEHNQLEQVLQQETGIRVKDGDQEKVKAFLNREVSFAYTFKGLTKLTPFDLLLVIDELYNQITKHYPNLSTQEIKTAFSNGISHLYDERGNYNIGLGGSAFMFFIKHYNEDKKKLKNSHVARNRETKKEKEINLNLRKIAQEKHDQFFSEKFDNFLQECENILIEGMNLNFSVVNDSDIVGLTPFLKKECKKMNCLITDTQEKTINNWVDELEKPNINYRYRVEFEVLVLNLFRIAMNIPEDKYFVLFTKPNKE
jgi:hypothetical protein